jgi:spermidine synthase
VTPRREILAIIVASIAMLALEIAQVRIFSYSLDPLLVFGAISVAMVGMGAGGIAIALRPVSEEKIGARLAESLAAFGITTVIAHAIFARTSDRVGYGALLSALPVLGVLVVPYFFAGVVVAIAMTRRKNAIGELYLANMLGSGAGALLVHPLLGVLGAEGIVAGCAALVSCAAIFVERAGRPEGRRGRRGWILIALAATCLLAAPFAKRLYPFRPDPGDLYGVARAALSKQHPEKSAAEYAPSLEYARWDPVARVEVWGFPGPFGMASAGNETAPIKFFAQDGGAGSILFDLRDRPTMRAALFEGTVYGGAYFVRSPRRALIVGLGGGPDVIAAEHYRVGEVTGVEINATAIDVVGGAYAELLGRPYERAGVTIVHHDGRGFIERTTDRYDLVQMSGADTYAAGSTGAFMFSESYLYTLEGFGRWISALSDDGVLSVIRFGLEPIRVVTTELAALRAMGVVHPEQHLIVLRQGLSVNVLCSKRPFVNEDLARLARAVVAANALPRMHIAVYDALGFGLALPIEIMWAPGAPAKSPYAELFSAAAQNKEESFIAAAALDFEPVTDDRPFFFQFLAARHLPRVLSAPANDWYARGLRAHGIFVVAIVLLSIVLIVLPVSVVRRRGVTSVARPIAYFVVVGFAYLAVEMGWMQRTGLFLGHPTHAVVVTLVTLLVASGLGSAWAARRKEAPHLLARGAAIAVVALLALAEIALPRLLAAMLSLPLFIRVITLVLATAPLGFAMGIPFPSGLRVAGQRDEALVAWGLAANAFASIIASLVAVPFAIFAGFRALGVCALALYALAALLAPADSSAT